MAYADRADGARLNVQLHDYTGHAGDVWTDGNGMVTIVIPPNDNGAGYVGYSRTVSGGCSRCWAHRATRVFFGAADLDIGPAANGAPQDVGRIWCAGGRADQRFAAACGKPLGPGQRAAARDPRARRLQACQPVLERQRSRAGIAGRHVEGPRLAPAAADGHPAAAAWPDAVRTDRDLYRVPDPGVSHARCCHHSRLRQHPLGCQHPGNGADAAGRRDPRHHPPAVAAAAGR
ncbi:MAG: DUF1939 domain-containing protein [Solirubrobacterales bacterium]|nr:DUF1939 domain-containing protein [Solirubrobacterales bacterium]